MSHSVKLVLRTQKQIKTGEAPISVRIIIDKKISYQSTGFKVLPEDWDEPTQAVKKSNKNYKEINRAIQKKKSDQEKLIANIITSDQELNIKFVRRSKSIPFEEFCNDKIKLWSSGKGSGTIRNYEKHVNKFIEFTGNIYTSTITGLLFDKYKSHLLEQDYANNYVWDAFKVLGKFIRAAMKENILKTNPFNDMEQKPAYKQVSPDYLTIDELDQLEALFAKDLNNTFKSVLAYFLLECYSGLRNSDWRRFSIEKLVHENNLKVGAKKNGEPIYLPIDDSPRLKRILKRISELQPYNDTLESTNRVLKSIAVIAGIHKNLRTHIGRHTFGVLCAQLGLSKETTAELMGITTRVVDVYYKVTRIKVKNEFKVWSKIEAA